VTRGYTWLITRRRGQSLVEFALVLPVFLLMILGLFDVGYAVYSYNTVANSARAAARVAIVNQNSADVIAEANAASAALGSDRISVVLYPCGVVGCPYGVTVSYDFRPVTPLIGNVFDPTISSTAEMPVENENENP
jgi:Flp pilus assembly protein TadG